MSGMAEDTRDALLEYQVGGEQPREAVVLLTSGRIDRRSSNGQYYIPQR